MNKNFGLILILFVFSCTNSKQSIEETENKCDHNFYSFFDNVVCVESFQNERSKILNWTFENLHPEKEFFFEVEGMKDKGINDNDKDVINEKYLTCISLSDSSVIDYQFQKIECKWYLTKKSKLKLIDYRNKDFIEFLNKFSHDSTFRMKHIKLPLKHGFLDYDDYSTQEKFLTKEELPQYDFFKNNFIYFLNNGKSLKVKLKFSIKGFGNGINSYYVFEYTNEGWIMIEDNDYST